MREWKFKCVIFYLQCNPVSRGAACWNFLGCSDCNLLHYFRGEMIVTCSFAHQLKKLMALSQCFRNFGGAIARLAPCCWRMIADSDWYGWMNIADCICSYSVLTAANDCIVQLKTVFVASCFIKPDRISSICGVRADDIVARWQIAIRIVHLWSRQYHGVLGRICPAQGNCWFCE